ncbi:MAG: NADPH:quinone oxidoreductase family protein [bacterium]
MKIVLCKEHGPPDRLVVEEVEPPHCDAWSVRIAVRAAGLNFPDLLIIRGKYQFQPPLPFAPGSEVAGIVTEVGSEVRGVNVGDRVLAMLGWNGFAEEVVAPGAACLAIPPEMDFDTAAGFSMTYGTSYHALVQRARLAPGETLLVLGASGGVGTAAIDIGRALGARVIAASASAEKLARLTAHFGLEQVVQTGTGRPLKELVGELTGGDGANVIYDPVGGELFEESLRAVAWEGRILVVGFTSGTIPAAKANLLLLKGASAVGVFWGAFARRDPVTNARNFEQLFAWYREGKLAPLLSHRFPLAQAALALQTLERREVIGKAVLQVSPA